MFSLVLINPVIFCTSCENEYHDGALAVLVPYTWTTTCQYIKDYLPHSAKQNQLMLPRINYHLQSCLFNPL